MSHHHWHGGDSAKVRDRLTAVESKIAGLPIVASTWNSTSPSSTTDYIEGHLKLPEAA